MVANLWIMFVILNVEFNYLDHDKPHDENVETYFWSTENNFMHNPEDWTFTKLTDMEFVV